MRLQDIWQACLLDLDLSVVLVLKTPKRPIIGVGIGSPLAAGFAQLAVSWKEEKKDRRRHFLLAQEMRRKILRMRWMDDLVVLCREELSEEALEEVASYLSEGFYGKHLVLEQADGCDAFGYLVEMHRDGVFGVRPRLGFLHRRFTWDAAQAGAAHPIRITSGIHGGPQWRPDVMERSVAAGALFRLMDMTTAVEEEVINTAIRMMLEYRMCGFGEKGLLAALAKVQVKTMVDLTRVRKAVRWEQKDAKHWIQLYDVMEEARVKRADEAVKHDLFAAKVRRRAGVE